MQDYFATSTILSHQAALRSMWTVPDPPAHTCGNTQGGVGGRAASDWLLRAEGGATSKSPIGATPLSVRVIAAPSSGRLALPRNFVLACPGLDNDPDRPFGG